MDKTCKKLRGFTLIELIVVITIIAVLAGIIVPSILETIRNKKITTANTQAQQVFTAAQNYLLSEQLKGVKPTDIATDVSKLCWIAVRTDPGSDANLYDGSNVTDVKDSYNVNPAYSMTSVDGKTYYKLADGIENRLETGFKGSWVVAYYPQTFTVAYAVYNDNYPSSSDCDAAVFLVGTNSGGSDTDSDNRLYKKAFYVGDGTALVKIQERDFKSPQSSEAKHQYTGQYPIPGPTIS